MTGKRCPTCNRKDEPPWILKAFAESFIWTFGTVGAFYLLKVLGL